MAKKKKQAVIVGPGAEQSAPEAGPAPAVPEVAAGSDGEMQFPVKLTVTNHTAMPLWFPQVRILDLKGFGSSITVEVATAAALNSFYRDLDQIIALHQWPDEMIVCDTKPSE